MSIHQRAIAVVTGTLWQIDAAVERAIVETNEAQGNKDDQIAVRPWCEARLPECMGCLHRISRQSSLRRSTIVMLHGSRRVLRTATVRMECSRDAMSV